MPENWTVVCLGYLPRMLDLGFCARCGHSQDQHG